MVAMARAKTNQEERIWAKVFAETPSKLLREDEVSTRVLQFPQQSWCTHPAMCR